MSDATASLGVRLTFFLDSIYILLDFRRCSGLFENNNVTCANIYLAVQPYRPQHKQTLHV